VIWLTWIKDCLIAGDKKGVKTAKEQIKSWFDCNDVKILNKLVGFKIEHDEASIMLLQGFEDKFKCKAGKGMVPAEAGGVLMKKSDQEKALSEGEQTHYSSGVRKLLHTMHWSRPEIYNARRDLSSYMITGTIQAHVKAMERVKKNCLSTRERGLELRPELEWTRNPEFKLMIFGRPDSD